MIRDLLEGLVLGPLIETVRAEAEDLLDDLELKATRAMHRIQRAVRYAITECLLWMAAGGFALAALIIFLSRFLPVDLVLIGVAIVLAYLALLARLMR